MKKLKYSIGFFVFAILMSLTYYASYKINVQRELNQPDSLLDQEMKMVDQAEEHVITKGTTCIIQHYDLKTKDISQEIRAIPSGLLGMKREELITYLKESQELYGQDTEDQYTLQSFSQDSIVLRKKIKNDAKYYLTEEDEYVVVYYGDRETVYEYTDIRIRNLPDKVKEEILEGKFVQDDHDLYSFLENYTS